MLAIRPMRPCAVTAFVAALIAWLGTAQAHVAPALDTNNRYLRITPMRERIRLAYTVYIGELPGAQARQRMDRDHDGQLDGDESKVYGDELARQVLGGLDITVDGPGYDLAWSETYVGLGTPTTNAGSFSVDLIGWICTSDRATHTAVIFDRYSIELPGETELKVQKSPGIEITQSSLGEDDAVLLEMNWRGLDGPMATSGLHIAYQVDAALAVTPPGDHCRTQARVDTPLAQRNWLAVLALASVGAAALALLIRQRRRRRGNGDESSGT